MSLILGLTFLQIRHRITAMAAVAVRKALNKATGLNIGIKWPNDIIIDGKRYVAYLRKCMPI